MGTFINGGVVGPVLSGTFHGSIDRVFIVYDSVNDHIVGAFTTKQKAWEVMKPGCIIIERIIDEEY